MTDWQTVDQASVAETEEKKSRFIVWLVPYEMFEAELARLKAEHPKANHHVTAFRHVLEDGQIVEGAKDDGEPSGTSGMPMLKVLIGNSLMDVGVICIRYFGGTKLGTGGLARAYSGAAREVIEHTEKVRWQKIITISMRLDFAKASRVEQLVDASRLSIIERNFATHDVELFIEGPKQDLEALQQQISPE